MKMARYLNYLDTLKERYIKTQNQVGIVNYPYPQFHFYQDVTYTVDKVIHFRQPLRTVKLVNTAVLFCAADTKVYFTDNDIAAIIALIDDSVLKEHIISYLNKAIAKKGLETVSFLIQAKSFSIKGIPFNEKFNDITCENPADIDMNGNDLIALINLVLEKERADKNPKKLEYTAKKYMGVS